MSAALLRTVWMCALLAACARPDASGGRSADTANASFAITHADTIALTDTVAFVRPVRHLDAHSTDALDFRPYQAQDDWDTFQFVAGAERYTVMTSGAGARTAGTTQHFELPVDSGFVIERLAYTSIDDDPVFVVQQGNGDSGSGAVIRLDGGTLQPRWIARLPGFNVGAALRHGDFLYVSCFGFAGKLRLDRGTFVWRHDDLFASDRLNQFEAPRLASGIVTFPAGSRALRIDDTTGRRVRP